MTMPLIEDYDYFLPPELVAQYPLARAGCLPAAGAPAGTGARFAMPSSGTWPPG